MNSKSYKISTPAVNSNGGDGLGSTWFIWRRRRYVIAFLGFLGFVALQTQRICLSSTIIAMTTTRNVTLHNGTILSTKDFDWNSKIQGHMLSSFFYGYISTPILGGWLASRVGGNKVFGVGVAVAALLTLLTPALLKINGYFLLPIRVFEGFFQGIAFPSIHALWARWAPENERSTLTTLALCGIEVGFALTFPVSGIIVHTLGWSSVFYVFGTFGLLWFVVWSVLVKSGPEDDPNISEQELNYIQKSLGSSPQKVVVHPWKKFFTSFPVWAVVIAHTCDNWGYYLLLTELPAFMKDILNYDLEKSGLLTVVPYVMLMFVMPFIGCLADWLHTDRNLSATLVRKLYGCGAYTVQAVIMITIAYVHDTVVFVICLSISTIMLSFSWSAFCVNLLDIAPQHASVLLGLSNTISTLPGIIGPTITGFVVQHHSPGEWQTIFCVASAFYIFAAVFYGTFATGERQSWAKEYENNGNTKENNIVEKF